MIDTSKCLPNSTASCNVTTIYNYTGDESNGPAGANIVSAYDLSDFLCYMDINEKGFNVTTFYDKFGFLNT